MKRGRSVHGTANPLAKPAASSRSWTTTDYSRQGGRVPDYSRQGGRARKSQPRPLIRARSFPCTHSPTYLLLLLCLDRVSGLILLLSHGGGPGLPRKPSKILTKKDDAKAKGHVLDYVLDKLTKKSSLKMRCNAVVFQAERQATEP